MINQTDLAMTIATECYKYFTDFFGIEDVVPKAGTITKLENISANRSCH